MSNLIDAIKVNPKLYRRLTPKERWVIYLYLQGVPMSTIAQKMKVPFNHVQQIYHQVSEKVV